MKEIAHVNDVFWKYDDDTFEWEVYSSESVAGVDFMEIDHFYPSSTSEYVKQNPVVEAEKEFISYTSVPYIDFYLNEYGIKPQTSHNRYQGSQI